MKLSIGDIQNFLRQAGWPEELIVTAAAVFYYESAGGNTEAHKVDSVERSYGLAQINLGLPGSRLAAERAPWGPPERLYDPLYNLSLALQIYNQQGWRAWTNTYYGGRYQQYLAASQTAYDQGSTVSTNDSNAFPPAPGDVSVATVVAVIAGALLLSVILDL